MAEAQAASAPELPPLSCETPLPGLVVYQPQKGFRYAMDPFLLSAFALEGGTARTVIDLGTGSGIMALLLARLGMTTTGIDLQPEWVAMARLSAAESGLANATFVHADARSYGGTADLVVCNPPYFKAGSGKRPGNSLKAHARHELAGTLSELVAAAAGMAPRICLVLPAKRSTEAARILARHGRPLSRRLLLEPKLVLLEGREGAVEGDHIEEIVPLRDRRGAHHRRVHRLYGRLGIPLDQGAPRRA